MQPPKPKGGKARPHDEKTEVSRPSRSGASDVSFLGSSEFDSIPEEEPPSGKPRLPPPVERESSASGQSYRTGSDYGPRRSGSHSDLDDGLAPLDDDLPPSASQPSASGSAGVKLGDEEDAEAEAPPAPLPEVRSRTQTRVAVLDDEALKKPSDEDDANNTRAGPAVKLEIIEGPDAGKKRKFSGVRMVVGRVEGVDVRLSDASVSRKHFELIYGDKGVLLRDLGSGNGTRVNGEKVAERLLQHEDVIHIGKTKIKLHDEMQAYRRLREHEIQEAEERRKAEESAEAEAEAKRREEEEAAAEDDEVSGAVSPDEVDLSDPSLHAATSPSLHALRPQSGNRLAQRWAELEQAKKKWVLVGAGGVFLAVVALIVVVVAIKWPRAPKVAPAQVQAQAVMQKAREAVRAEKYEEAVRLIGEADQLWPGIDADGLQKRAVTELGAQRALESIRGHVEAGRFEDARSELAAFPSASAKADEAKVALQKELVAKEIDYKRQDVLSKVKAGELEAARQALGELSLELQRELEGTLIDAEREQADLERRDKVAAAAAAKRRAEAAREKRHQEIEDAFANVARKFNAMDWQRAVLECDRVVDANRDDPDIRARAKQLQTAIPNFGRNFEEGHRKYKANQLAAAAKSLRRAREIWVQIGFPGALGEQINEELAAAALAAGQDALLQDDLLVAHQNFRDAAKLDPSDGRAKAGLEKVALLAEDVYERAYMLRGSEPREALAKFKIVLAVTPPGSAVHEKAKNQIASLQP